MIRSMTGYGKVTVFSGTHQVTAEIKTLNSKQLDLGIRLPSVMSEYEHEVRSLAGTALERGKVMVQIVLGDGASGVVPEIDLQLAAEWYRQIRRLEEHLGLPPMENYLEVLLKMPDMLKQEPEVADPAIRDTLIEVMGECLRQVNAFRTREGMELGEEIEERIRRILPMVDRVTPLERGRTVRIKEKLSKALEENGDLMASAVDQNRLEQEMIYYLEKLDVTEEKVRLVNHLRHFLQVMTEPAANGRKLGFIAQEIGREINTLGSKAHDYEIQQIVVEMKDELEKVKEQLFNIL
jgi:uncharacterized protein (TIGR00255 family)